jgi:transcription antitermination factor NusG
MDQHEYGINWYAIQVRPRAEFSTANILLSKGLEPYVPQYRATRKWSDRQVKIDLPLLPGYVFCRFDATFQLLVIKTSGVVRIVGTRKMPLPVSPHELDAIRKVVQVGFNVQPYPFIAVGDKVRIDKGPLAGVEGIVREHKNRQLILSVSLVQQSVSVQIGDVQISTAVPIVSTAIS